MFYPLALIIKSQLYAECWNKHTPTDLLGGPVAKTLHPNGGSLGSIPGQGTKSLHAASKDSTCCKEDPRSHTPLRRPGVAK